MYKERAGNRVTFAIWNIPHETIFHFKNFIGGVREYFANGFVLSLYQSCAHTKTLFSFFLFYELAAERKLCYGGGDEENFK